MQQLATALYGYTHVGVAHRVDGDKVDFPVEQVRQGVPQIEVGIEQAHGRVRLELNEEVDVAGGDIEVIAARGRAKYLQSPDVETPAQLGDLLVLLCDRQVHMVPRGA